MSNFCATSKQAFTWPRGVGVGKLDPRNAADHIGAERHGLLHQRERARLAHDAVLGERDDLQIDNAAEFVAEPQ